MKILFTIAAALLLMGGCMISPNTIKNKTVKEYPDGSVITTEIMAKGPKFPAGQSVYSNGITGAVIKFPPAQSESEIEEVKQEGKNKRLMYAGAALLIIIGGIAFALPNNFVSNRDAAIVVLLGILSFAGLRYVEKSENIMGVVLPVMIVVSAGWIGYNHYKGKKRGVIPN